MRLIILWKMFLMIKARNGEEETGINHQSLMFWLSVFISIGYYNGQPGLRTSCV
eukprot:gnl/Chilomastix_caulleri/8078.p2 GENE.gnl/Chilomastix_caulleri/8078~~gnl/Chilomastix_caulleri/8078.p2  ORF type:complete len:54 (-),score=12.37 gnl/Chilomastix_caulleri/8078:74-235(-)